MPFEDLTDSQQKFILNNFKSGGFRKKTKKNYEDFNNRLQRELVPLYQKINDIKALITRIEAAESDVPDEGPHVPTSLYRGRLDDLSGQIESTLASNRKQMKAGLVPDFKPVSKELNALEDRINLQFDKIHSGTRADALSDAEKLLMAKEGAASAHQDMLDAHLAQTDTTYVDAREKMKFSELIAVKERNKKWAEYNNAYEAARKEIANVLKQHGEDESVSSEAFTSTCADVAAAFTRVGDALRTRIIELGNQPPVTLERLAERKAEEGYASTDTVQISAQRAEALDNEMAKLLGTMDDDSVPVGDRKPGAIDAQKAKLEALREEYRAASEQDKGALKGQYVALQAQIERLEIRKAQLEAYAENELSRDRQIVASIEAALQAKDDANDLARALAAEDADLSALDYPWMEASAHGEYSILVAAKIIDYRRVVEASAARDLIVQKLSHDEPTPKEISPLESSTLLTMLDNTQTLVEEGRVDVAEKLYEEVVRLRREFMSARFALQLPPITEPEPSKAIALIRTLEFIRSDANDLWGQGADAAAALAREAATLIDQVKADDLAGRFVADPALHKTEVQDLRTRVDALRSAIAPTEIPADKIAAATGTANDVSSFLDNALKTKPLKETDIVREPGRTYPEQAEKHLIPAENLIMVEVDGEMVQHKIVTSIKKGGLETASTARGNKVPVDVLEAMLARNHALRAMTEVDTPGGEVMLDVYAAEAKAWFDDVSEHGDTIYPELAKLISDCDKIMSKGSIATYIPDAYPNFKTRYDAFKSGYLKKKPTDAKAEGDPLKEELADLELTAEETVKADYDAAKVVYDRILANLTGKKQKRGDPQTLGGFVEEFLSRSPEEVFAGVKDLTDQGAEDVAKARSEFMKLKKYYASEKVKISPKSVDGPWLNNAKTELKTVETKIYSNIVAAKTRLTAIDKEVSDYLESVSDMSGLSSDALAAKIDQLCQQIVQSTIAAGKTHNKIANFNRNVARQKLQIEAVKKQLKKLGRNPVAQDLSSQADTLESRRSAAEAKAKADQDYDSGATELDDIKADLVKISEAMAGLDPTHKVPVKKFRIGERLSTLETVLGKFATRASEITAKDITPKMSETQLELLGNDVAVIDAGLKKNTDVISIAALKRITDDIDAKNDDKEKSWKAERTKLREQALKEMRAIRTQLETHPAAQLYAGNPFDGGMNMRLVLAALHHVEIAVLSCVSPKDPD